MLRQKILTKDDVLRLGGLPVTSPQLMIKKGELNPEGLLSSEIFGLSISERKYKTGYIQLNKPYINPLIYNSYMKRRFRSTIINIISGAKTYSIDKDGNLVEDVNGGTGIKWFYDNVDKINFSKSRYDGDDVEDDESITSKELRDNFIKVVKEGKLFVDFVPIIPIYLRDVNRQNESQLKLDALNALYQKTLSLDNMLQRSKDNPLSKESLLDLRIQNSLNDIYNYFKDEKIFGKDGIQRQKTMGKNVDYAARFVISAQIFKGSFGSSNVDMEICGVPLSGVIGMYKPHMLYQLSIMLNGFFTKGYFGNLSKDEFDYYFDRKMLSELIDKYIHSVGERFDYVYAVNESGDKCYLEMVVENKLYNATKKITMTELMYMAAKIKVEDEGYHLLLSRYPIMSKTNMQVQGIHVLSTIKTIHTRVDGMVFDSYPNVFDDKTMHILTDVDVAESLYNETIALMFHETVKISNTLLKSLDGDFDGDKVALRGIYSKKANRQAKAARDKLSFILGSKGELIKMVYDEPVQCLYSLSINPDKNSKVVDRKYVDKLLNAPYDTITPKFILRELGLGDTIKTKRINRHNDIVMLKKGDLKGLDKDITTTFGRVIIYKILFEENASDVLKYINEPYTDSVVKGLFDSLKRSCISGDLELGKLKRVIKIYEDFGFRMSSFIAPSVDSRVFTPPKEFIDKRNELMKKYEKELKEHNIFIAEKITNELVEFAKPYAVNNPNYEWYQSGASGKMGWAAFKVANVMVGTVPTGESASSFYVATSNYIDGIKKTDIQPLACQGVSAAHMRAVNTAVGGAKVKEGTQLLESVIADELGSDCGSKQYISIVLNKENIDAYIGATLDNGKVITFENAKSILGDNEFIIVQMRSPMGCLSPNICSVCLGKGLYTYTSNEDADTFPVGIEAVKMFSDMSQASLQKTHVMGAKLKDLSDINDYFVKIKKP